MTRPATEALAVGVKNFVGAMVSAGIAPIPIYVRVRDLPKPPPRTLRRWRRPPGHALVSGPMVGWVYAVGPAFGERNRVFYLASPDATVIMARQSPLHGIVEAHANPGTLIPKLLGAEDPDAAFRVDRVKKYGPLPTGAHPLDPYLKDWRDAASAGFRTVDGYRQFLAGAPAEWVRAFEEGRFEAS